MQELTAETADRLSEAPPPPLPLRHPRRILTTALGLGVLAEVLFDGKPLGLSFPLFAGASVVSIQLLAGREGRQGSRRVQWLLAPLLLLAGFVAVRENEALTTLNVLASIALFGIWVQGFNGTLSAVDLKLWELPGRSLQGFFSALIAAPAVIPQAVDTQRLAGAARSAWKPVVKAVAITVPIVLVFVALLASGDPVFARFVDSVVDGISPGGGTLSTVGVIAGATLGMCGLVAHALRRRVWDLPPGNSTPARTWLGAAEGLSIVYALVTLFAVFAAVKAKELFVSHSALIPQAPGIGWGTYAREGFEQLTLASALTLSLLIAVPRFAKLDTVQRAFRFGATALVGLTLLLLATAANRLAACEEAYGFTVPRVFGQFFVFALGGVLLWRALTVWVWRNRFAVGALAGALGWILALDIANPEAMVVEANLARGPTQQQIDWDYLLTLSRDAAVAYRTAAPKPGGDGDEADSPVPWNVEWQSWTWARSRL